MKRVETKILPLRKFLKFRKKRNKLRNLVKKKKMINRMTNKG